MSDIHEMTEVADEIFAKLEQQQLEIKALRAVVRAARTQDKASRAIPKGNHPHSVIQQWLIDDMTPAVEGLRTALEELDAKPWNTA